MATLRRSLVLAALFFWQGGFTFYTSIVVPIGTNRLGRVEQGFITREVTEHLNVAGVIALLVMGWDLVAARDPSRFRNRLRMGLWVLLWVGLAGLFWMHQRMDGLLDASDSSVRDAKAFYPLHRVYLWISTGQWGCGLAFLWTSVQGWRASDRLGGADSAQK